MEPLMAALNVLVCAKQIPNSNADEGFDPTTKTLLRSEPLTLDDADTFGIELALRLVEGAGAGAVTAVSMAPNSEIDGLRSALALGAHNAILVSDPALGGTDALGTAKVLAAVARRVGADLVVAATESTDGYTGTVPVQVAELLGLPAVSFARNVELDDQLLHIQRQTEEGSEDIDCPLPAVITVTNGTVEVRYPSFKAKMAAKSKQVEILTLSDLELDGAGVGAPGARQEVVAITVEDEGEATGSSAFASVFGKVQKSKASNVIEDDGTAHDRILASLTSWNAL
jgi:electron transfer flavoprotein beta subunit